jgi:FkbM family methyltransferase
MRWDAKESKAKSMVEVPPEGRGVVMLTVVKTAGKRLFGLVGLDIQKKRRDDISRTSFRGALRQLKSIGCRARTVIDVGVAYHTSELYEEFAGARFLLIEPLVEFEVSLREICRRYKAEYVLAAAGEAPGTATLSVHSDGFSSSLLKEVEGPAVDGMPRQVPVVTIDGLCAEKKLVGPYLIKVDVQGAELRVLEGTRRTLEQTEAVILEVSWFGFMIGAPQLYDVLSWMKQVGFVAYDIFGFLYRPLDRALAQADIVFVRERGRFRQSHAFATSEQRLQIEKENADIVNR